jgi:hypothetical protein
VPSLAIAWYDRKCTPGGSILMPLNLGPVRNTCGFQIG